MLPARARRASACTCNRLAPGQAQGRARRAAPHTGCWAAWCRRAACTTSLTAPACWGRKLLFLGQRALEQRPLAALARPHLDLLAQQTGDTVPPGAVEGDEVFYLDKVFGTEALEMRSRTGQRMPRASTGVGKALMQGMGEERWEALYRRAEEACQGRGDDKPPLRPWALYLEEMRRYRAQGVVLDLEENALAIAK